MAAPPLSFAVRCEFFVDPSSAWTNFLHFQFLLSPFQIMTKILQVNFVERNSNKIRSISVFTPMSLIDNDFCLLLCRIAAIDFLFNWTSISKMRVVEAWGFQRQTENLLIIPNLWTREPENILYIIQDSTQERKSYLVVLALLAVSISGGWLSSIREQSRHWTLSSSLAVAVGWVHLNLNICIFHKRQCWEIFTQYAINPLYHCPQFVTFSTVILFSFSIHLSHY